MSINMSYLITTKNINSIFDALLQAEAPKKMTSDFLEKLGFKSSNDRKYISLFKSLGLINENGEPTNKYCSFLDKSISKKVIAQSIKESYKELFSVNKEAYKMTNEEVKNKLRTIIKGEKTEHVISLIASTFVDLCNYAGVESFQDDISYNIDTSESDDNNFDIAENTENLIKNDTNLSDSKNIRNMNLHYNIQIHLPETTSIEVYDAIFQSLKKHLI